MLCQHHGNNCGADCSRVLLWLWTQQCSAACGSFAKEIKWRTGIIHAPHGGDSGTVAIPEPGRLQSRKGQDRIGVVVRPGSRRQADVRVSMRRDCAKDIAERCIHFRSAPDRKRQLAPRPQHPPRLLQNPWWVRHVWNPEADGDNIELRFTELQIHCVALDEACVRHSVSCHRKHCGREIEARHSCAATDQSRGDIAMPAAQIKRFNARLGLDGCNDMWNHPCRRRVQKHEHTIAPNPHLTTRASPEPQKCRFLTLGSPQASLNATRV